ncbi:LysR substrate-binding domain-containing protein [Vibrio mediterranei]|uniref:LysR substrate-binding domain-containing protein n=1 Tax=Vibrio mediterranei TaxID=689 RepID=UPI00148BF0B8|nr:LysR substrate-binding domain-containing protein [Vibrio mediterranei]NOI25680.1 LysR family transcriptional regulator [Vibrio mediterranei]
MNKYVALKSIYTFVAVAETGSMSEAAQKLFVSHSAVSQSIKSLEAQLDTKLFHRIGRRIELNQQGRLYYKKVAPALEKIVEANEALLNKTVANRLTVNMVNSLALHWWIPRVTNLQHYAPNLDIRISNLIGSFNLEREGVDVALIHGKTDEWQDYYCEKLGDDELVLVCSPNLLDQHTVISLDAVLVDYPSILVTNDRRKHDWDTWCKTNALTLPRYHNHLIFNASVQAIHAAIRGLGILVTHRLFIKDEVEQGLLVELGSPTPNPYQAFYFACSPKSLKYESVITLRRWLRTEFGKKE